MFDKVLIPIELSDFDNKVIQFVAGLGNYGIKEAVLVHVANLKGIERPVAVRQEKQLRSEIEERAAAIGNVSVKPILVSGLPHEEILSTANQERASLIVCGTRGKGAFNELAIGSVSEMLGRRAQMPVLMVPYRTLEEIPDDQALAMGKQAFAKVVFPTDFSDVSERALETIKSLSCDQIGEIVVTHVIESKELKPETKDSQIRSTKRILAAIKDELEACGLEAKAQLIVGTAIAELLQMGEEMGATLYVMGSHGKGIREEFLIGSVSQNIIRLSKRPVLITH